jgi:hypothetical protein
LYASYGVELRRCRGSVCCTCIRGPVLGSPGANANHGHRLDNSGQFAITERLRKSVWATDLLRGSQLPALPDEPREEALALYGDGGVGRISDRRSLYRPEVELSVAFGASARICIDWDGSPSDQCTY